jgi:hypothetical protein
MPQYLDHHPTIPDMPPELVASIELDLRDVAEVQVLP